MTERDLGQSFSWFIATVVNVYDPDQSGRVQIRVFGRHDDVSNIPDTDLPWAMPMQPVTSAAYGKIGSTPLGLVKGSKVAGFWADSDHQYPIILGSFGKAGDFVEGSTTDGIPKIDTTTGSAPAPSQNQSPPPFINPFSILNKERLSITDINTGKADPSKLTNKDGVEIRKELDKTFKQPKTPTIGATAPGGHILDMIKTVDPNGRSSSLPNMVSNYSNIKNIINITSPLGQTNLFGASIGGMLGNLGALFGVNKTLSIIGGALLGGALNNLDPISSAALSAGLFSFLKTARSNGGRTNAYVPPRSNRIGKNTPIPPLNLIVAVAYNLYIQQYYTIDNDPYPGYIEWQGPNKDYIYTLRNDEPNYSSAQDHVQGNSILNLTSSFLPHMNSGSLSAAALTGLMVGGLSVMNADGLTKVLGFGVNLNSITGLANGLLGQGLGGAIGGFSKNISGGVLGGSMENTLGSYTRGQALLQQKKNNMMSALAMNTPSLGSLNPSQLIDLSSIGLEAGLSILDSLGG